MHHQAPSLARSRLGRLGGWAADHRRPIALVWCALVLTLGALAPFADRALSGAGWEAHGSESLAARTALEERFPGRGSYELAVVVAGPRAERTLAQVADTLRRDPAVAGVRAPQAGPRDTAVLVGLAGAPPGEMVEAASRLRDRLATLSTPEVTVRLTGAAALWADFNEANKAAMLKAELLSWPLTLVLLLLAFGTLVAAGLPLLLTMAGLLGAGGLLFLAGQVTDVSIWAMNFAMMFAIALGIDYALFIVVRFRAALAAGLAPREATVETMATAGRAVLVSGLTVIAALMAVTLLPVPAFRTVPLGIAFAVLMVLATTLTLLPAVLSRLGHRINRGRVPVGGGIDHRSARFARWGRRLWARPLPYGAAALALLRGVAVRRSQRRAARLAADAEVGDGRVGHTQLQFARIEPANILLRAAGPLGLHTPSVLATVLVEDFSQGGSHDEEHAAAGSRTNINELAAAGGGTAIAAIFRAAQRSKNERNEQGTANRGPTRSRETEHREISFERHRRERAGYTWRRVGSARWGSS